MRPVIARLSGTVATTVVKRLRGVDQGRIGGAGQTTVVAGRDVSMEAGIISSDVNTKVAAGRNVTMKAMNANT